MTKELPIKDWALTLVFNAEIEEEIVSQRIEGAFPRQMMICKDWLIERVDVSEMLDNFYIVDIYARSSYAEDEEERLEVIRTFSPKVSGLRSFDELIGSTINDMSILFTIRRPHLEGDLLCANFIRVSTDRSRPGVRRGKFNIHTSPVYDMSEVVEIESGMSFGESVEFDTRRSSTTAELAKKYYPSIALSDILT